MANNSGSGVSKQAKDANGFVVGGVFLAPDSRHVIIQTAFGTVCSQILGLSGTAGEVKFVELTSTVACHFKPSTTKAAVSGVLFIAGDNPYCAANFPKIIALGENTFIGVRAAAGQLAGTMHITLLE